MLVRTAARSLNPDWKTRVWDVGTLPATLGGDLAGTVVTSNDSRWRPGDRVIAMSAQIAPAAAPVPNSSRYPHTGSPRPRPPWA
ncbi:hypothetical protein OH799_05640 [Nocardia sp. NBC_00881]|uniref:alcohol dehydrogenase catalytic domain-containing protein n=1 Tax=Nocardia sp. NBC_00881 TaxID=2975995 RepID=UPI003869CC45|nr:hypothetical protein OH799_05640 [Nocardia sp. NBC_00881]